MNDEIKAGNILIQEGVLLPETMQIASERSVPGWRLAQDVDGYELGRRAQKVGWAFFCLAGEIKSIAFGTNHRSMVFKAIRRILANPRSNKFNSLEITRIVSKQFLGIRCMRVGAQSRHIQRGLFLSSADERRLGETRLPPVQITAWGATSNRGSAREGTNGRASAAAGANL